MQRRAREALLTTRDVEEVSREVPAGYRKSPPSCIPQVGHWLLWRCPEHAIELRGNPSCFDTVSIGVSKRPLRGKAPDTPRIKLVPGSRRSREAGLELFTI